VADPQLWVYEGQGGSRQSTDVQSNTQTPRWPQTLCVSTAARSDPRVCFDIRDDYPFDEGELLAFGCAAAFTADDVGKTHAVQVGDATVYFALSKLVEYAPDQCHDECQRNVLPRLPVLTASNRADFPLWHAYIERRYHQQISGAMSVDLNTFSMFYHASNADGGPLDAIATLFVENPCLRICTLESWPNRRPVYDGSPFVGDSGPEMRMNALAFFVHRPFISRAEVQNCERLEVMHLRTEWLGGERGVSWFFNTVGSGVFIDCHNLPHEGRIQVHQNREEWEREHGREWPLDPHVPDIMEDEGLNLLVFTAADFTVFDTDGTNPSTEIVVRHRDSESSEATSDRGSCLDDDDIGIVMRTGIRGGLACRCRKRDPPMASINCEDTPYSPCGVGRAGGGDMSPRCPGLILFSI